MRKGKRKMETYNCSKDINSRTEEIIWNTITNSAKKRFDYNKFAATFQNIPNDHVAENVLFKVISEFSTGKDINSVAASLRTQMLIVGYVFAIRELVELLANKEEKLKQEIQVTRIARTMLADGSPSDMTLAVVQKML
jgi:hypothetical protein